MNDPPAIATARYLSDPNLRLQTGQRARQHVIDSFTIARTAEKVQQRYNQFTSNPHRACRFSGKYLP